MKEIKRIPHFKVKITVLIILVITLTFGIVNHHRHTFTIEKWAHYPEKRQLIVQDMLDTHEIVGMSLEDVQALLGGEINPNQNIHFIADQTVYPPDATLVYYLGRDNFIMSMESLFMAISFNKNNIATRVRFGAR